MIRRIRLFKMAIFILFSIFLHNAMVFAQQTSTIGNDTVVSTIEDESGNTVSLYLPESLKTDQCERRIYGTRTGVAGMFKTLYSEERRVESYEAAIRELSMQPQSSQSYLDDLKASMELAGVASEDSKFVLDMVKHGANAINKKYIKGGTLTADAHNKLALVGRKLNAAHKSPVFAEACLALENIKATAQLTDTIAGALLLNSLSTDQAWRRLEEIEIAIEAEKKSKGSIDPALVKAVDESKTNLLAAQSKIGAFAVSVNDNLQEITDSAINLGASLAEISAKFSAPVAMWVGAPLMTYNTLRGVSDQWEMAQDGVTLATVTKIVERNGQSGDLTENISSYGQYAFYSKMEDTFSVGGAKFKDLLSPGHANKDWANYYGEGKEKTIIVKSKTDDLEKGHTDSSNITANYKPTTKNTASTILREYKSVPGGVTLEGGGNGLEGIKKVSYRMSNGNMVINDSITYQIPVTRKDMKEILLAISKSDKMGVSLAGEYIVYGALPKENAITLSIRLVDKLLGHIAFGGQHEEEFGDYNLAKGYEPKKNQGPRLSGMCVYFRFGDYKFKKNSTRYELESSHLEITLVPTKKGARADDGGALPDFGAIEKGYVPSAWKENCEHISSNIEYYMKERMMRMVNCYGEAAAFARALKRNGIDLKKLADSM